MIIEEMAGRMNQSGGGWPCSNNCRASVPLTRYYLNEAEEKLKTREREIGYDHSAAAD